MEENEFLQKLAAGTSIKQTDYDYWIQRIPLLKIAQAIEKRYEISQKEATLVVAVRLFLEGEYYEDVVRICSKYGVLKEQKDFANQRIIDRKTEEIQSCIYSHEYDKAIRLCGTDLNFASYKIEALSLKKKTTRSTSNQPPRYTIRDQVDGYIYAKKYELAIELCRNDPELIDLREKAQRLLDKKKDEVKRRLAESSNDNNNSNFNSNDVSGFALSAFDYDNFPD